jgi:hypothetical protein
MLSQNFHNRAGTAPRFGGRLRGSSNALRRGEVWAGFTHVPDVRIRADYERVSMMYAVPFFCLFLQLSTEDRTFW